MQYGLKLFLPWTGGSIWFNTKMLVIKYALTNKLIKRNQGHCKLEGNLTVKTKKPLDCF